ncbi:MAG: outer membrane protein assembly factor BamD [Syntrophorhabdaceae bacterium]|nr:outer membrane protein assembly factor BamD [Syntrophorhabdaceae bacterium]
MLIPFRAWVAAATIVICLLPLGCSKKLAVQKNLSESALFARGQQMEQQKKHRKAAEAFRLLVERFPNSSMAPQSQFGLASNLMKFKENTEAEVAFDDFLRLYPANPKVADALLLKGELLRQQILPLGRSQDKARESIETYKQFLEKEKDTPRTETAVLEIRKLRHHLFLHEENIVSHLLSRKKYESAELRAKRVLEEYPDVTQTTKLQSMLAKALQKQGKNDDAGQAPKSSDEKLQQDASNLR